MKNKMSLAYQKWIKFTELSKYVNLKNQNLKEKDELIENLQNELNFSNRQLLELQSSNDLIPQLLAERALNK